MPLRPTCVGEGEACGGLGGDGLVECCEGASCVDGVCQVETGGVCGVLGDGCETTDDCCAGLTCFEALCDNPFGLCTGADEYCDGSVLCCDDLACADAVCSVPDEEPEEPGVTTLPDTGVGSSRHDSSQWPPLALGGASALVAGKLLRRSRNTEA